MMRGAGKEKEGKKKERAQKSLKQVRSISSISLPWGGGLVARETLDLGKISEGMKEVWRKKFYYETGS